MSIGTVVVDLPATCAAFTRRLGLPPERAALAARAVATVNPIDVRRLYCTLRAACVTDQSQRRAFDRVFREVFGTLGNDADRPEVDDGGTRDEASADETGDEGGRDVPGGGASYDALDEVPVPMTASDDEVLRDKRFDALTAAELASLARLMRSLKLATPERRTRRRVRDSRGRQIDLRRTLRDSRRTGGHPVVLRRRSRRVERRRLVLLCDISGSMEPYARAYLQFLAASGGSEAEAFVFATRLTRVTRALRTRSPQRAIARAAAAAPDWSSGTRIGAALKAFNNQHGRRGMARGAVVVILSDGWERAEPELLERELARLRRLAYRIVWVNPRVAAEGFEARTGGMAAALPFCDALVSGHSYAALHEVVNAIAADRSDDLPPTLPARIEEPEPWASATPVAGSSVAMPSGYGPKRGHTTKGWSL